MATEFVKKLKLVLIAAAALFGLIFIFGFTLTSYLKVLVTAVIAFGIYSLVTVLNMTRSFDSCVEAKEELDKEIKEAKAHYQKIGFHF